MVNVFTLAINDIKNIIRDKFLVYSAIVFPILFIVISQIFRLWIVPGLPNEFQFFPNNVTYYKGFFMVSVTMLPIVYGFIAAFLILDEKDEHLLTVLRVMPISRNTYLIYRMLILSIFSFIILLIYPALSGFLLEFPNFSYIEYIPTALQFAFLTPFSALMVTAFATNKVQAFAIFKISGTIYFVPLFSFFIANNFKYIFSPAPNFWTIISLNEVMSKGVNDYLHLVIGFIYIIVLIGLFFFVFNRKN